MPRKPRQITCVSCSVALFPLSYDKNVVFICQMSYFSKCIFNVWNPTIYQATDFACQVLCGINFWVDKAQSLLLSGTNVACHRIVIWFHLLHIFWVSKVLYCYKKNDLQWKEHLYVICCSYSLSRLIQYLENCPYVRIWNSL